MELKKFLRYFLILLFLILLVNWKYRSSLTFIQSNTAVTFKTAQIWKSQGVWKPGLKYKPTCQLDIYKSCCPSKSGRKQLHFVFHNEELNHPDVLKSLRRKFEGKNVTFFGDSLQRHLYEWTAEVLGIGKTLVKDERTLENGFTRVWHYLNPIQKPLLRRFGFFGFEQKGCHGKRHKHRLQTNRTLFTEALNVTDIIVLNMGLHFSYCNLSEFLVPLEKVARIIQDHIQDFPHKQVIIRSTLPQHFYNKEKFPDGDFRSMDFYKNNMKCSNKANFKEHWTNKHLKQIAEKYGFKYLDSFSIYAERGDLHEPNDCTHYCYTPELIVPELALLNRLLK